MPQITFKPGTKGLVQETGTVVAGEAIALTTTQTIAGSGTIDPSGALLVRISAGSAVSSVILSKGSVDGQICILVNVGDYTITFAAANTSNVGLGTAAVIVAGAAALCVYDSTSEHWHLTET